MTSTIKDLHRKVEISNVRDIIVTDIVEADGRFVRSIRILGDVGASQPAEVMEIVVSSATRSDIELSSPGYDF